YVGDTHTTFCSKVGDAGFAALNCLILSFSVAASRQFKLRRYKEGNRLLKPAMARITEFKKLFWQFRRRVYRGIRSTALMLAILVVCYNIYRMNTERKKDIVPAENPARESQLIPGLFFSQQADGLTRMAQVRQFQQQSNLSLGIVSCYIPWGDGPQSNLPIRLFDSIYTQGAIPMVTWEPWQKLFRRVTGRDNRDHEKKVFAAILAGEYDDYLQRF